jgi:NTP pyrophosphatase (non-canonical NTP hydrolase)
MLNTEQIDEWTRRLWATSQADRMVIFLAGEIQEVVDEIRAAAGLPELRE